MCKYIYYKKILYWSCQNTTATQQQIITYESIQKQPLISTPPKQTMLVHYEDVEKCYNSFISWKYNILCPYDGAVAQLLEFQEIAIYLKWQMNAR